MSPERWRDRINHILEAVRNIQQFVAGTSVERFVNDPMVVSAVAYQITVIGEASGHVPHTIRVQHPDIPWAEMRAMRNLLAHQ